MNERLEVVEKTADNALRLHLAEVLEEEATRSSPKTVIPMLDDDRVRSLIDRLYQENPGDHDLLAKLYEEIATGRGKAIPIFRYVGENEKNVMSYLPRLMHLVPQWEGSDALMALRKLKVNSRTQEDLDDFKKKYRAYQLRVWEALILAYRDPRLPEVYKLRYINEAVRADETGGWEQLKIHLASWPGERTAELERYDDLLQPGCLVMRRAGDDAAGYAIRDYRGRYHMALSELNKGSAYFAAHTPDAWDSVYHQILLEIRASASRYVGTWRPLNFLKDMNKIIYRIAPEPFVPTEKVKVKLGLERMRALVPRGSDSKRPLYVQSREGVFYKRQPGILPNWGEPLPENWGDTPEAKSLVPFQAVLSASRLFDDDPVSSSEILAEFNRLDKYSGSQKDRGWSERIISLRQLGVGPSMFQRINFLSASFSSVILAVVFTGWSAMVSDWRQASSDLRLNTNHLKEQTILHQSA